MIEAYDLKDSNTVSSLKSKLAFNFSDETLSIKANGEDIITHNHFVVTKGSSAEIKAYFKGKQITDFSYGLYRLKGF